MKAAGPEKSIKNLLEVLAENNRLGLVGGIVEKFDVLMGAHRGEVEVIITSATVRDGAVLVWRYGWLMGQQQLDVKTVGKLEAAISKSPLIDTGKKLKTTNRVCPPLSSCLFGDAG